MIIKLYNFYIRQKIDEILWDRYKEFKSNSKIIPKILHKQIPKELTIEII